MLQNIVAVLGVYICKFEFIWNNSFFSAEYNVESVAATINVFIINNNNNLEKTICIVSNILLICIFLYIFLADLFFKVSMYMIYDLSFLGSRYC